jgi:tetratricopeptide (TPR) repeat protein
MKFKKVFLLIPVVLLGAILLTVWLFGSTSKEEINQSNAFVKEAQELYEESEYTKAVEKFGKALEKYSQNSNAYLGLMAIFVEKGYVEEAKELVSDASIRTDSETSAKLFSMLGELYYTNGELENARKNFEEGVREDKSFPGARLGLSKTYLQQVNFDSARKNIGSLNVKGEDVEYMLLRAYISLDDWSQGSKIINSVNLNDIKDEELKERVSDLREIYALSDEDALYKNTSLAREYINGGYPFLAVEMFGRQEEEIEEYWDAQYYLGRAYLDLGEYGKAVEKLNNAIMLDVDDANLYIVLGRAYLLDNNVEKALDMYKIAMNMANFEEGEHLVREYISVLLENNMLNVARTFLTDLGQSENYVWIELLLCEVYLQQKDLGRLSGSIGVLELKTDLNRRHEKELIRYKILFALEDIQNESELAKLIKDYESFDKYNPEAYLFKGMLLKHINEESEATEALERAIELDLEGVVADKASKILAS